MIILRLLGVLWSLPVTLFGAIFVLPWCRPGAVRFRWLGHHGTRAIIEVDVGRWIEGYGAATFGHLQLYPEPAEPYRGHEDVHTLQGDLLGVLDATYFLFAAALWVYWLIDTGDLEQANAAAYWHNPLEAWARAWADRP